VEIAAMKEKLGFKAKGREVIEGNRGLKHITLEDMPRLKRLRSVHFATRPEVCPELAVLMTEYMEKMNDPSDSPELRAGKRLRYVLERKAAIIHEDHLLAGTTTAKVKGVPIYPQFLGLTLWPELETISTRRKNPYGISKEDIRTLNLKVFPYWMDKSIQEVCRKDNKDPYCQRVMERVFFFLASKANTISHTVPDYERVVKKGLGSIIRQAEAKKSALAGSSENGGKMDFYEAVKLALEGVLDYANRLSKEAENLARSERNKDRRKELKKISAICARVPKEGANSFHEALQAIWTCHVGLHMESNNISISLGRLDQILFPFYRMGIEEDTLTPRDAVELVGCFFLKLADHEPMSPETAEELFGGSGSNQAVTLGGVDQHGKDAVNDLTYLMLRATELLKVKDPNVNVRYYPKEKGKGNSRGFLNRLCEVNVTTAATPCFHNDMEYLKMLASHGYSTEDAHDYSIVGCVEPVRGGKTFGHTGAIMLNLPSALELALFQGKHRHTGEEQIGPETPSLSEGICKGFDKFLSLFERQLIFLIKQSVQLNNMLGKAHLEVQRLPLLSALTEGTLGAGKDVLEGGAVYNSSGVAVIGLAEVVDSLCTIKEFVFDRQEVSFPELIAGIRENWKGCEKLRQRIINSGNKFGTASKEAAQMADYLIALLHAEYQKRENYRGGKYRVGYWTMTTHAGWGVLTGALPSGRKDGDLLPSGITPVSGQAPELTEVLRFVANLDSTKIPNSHALNLKFSPSQESGRMVTDLADHIESYMRMGGIQVQFNIIDREILKEAQKDPAKHPNLLVRVSGYTAYFADLNPHMQNEIIERAEYSLQTGREVW
jgi:pyruvate formate-lyase/glycerol dehydratase family glycyl radical enzyme